MRAITQTIFTAAAIGAALGTIAITSAAASKQANTITQDVVEFGRTTTAATQQRVELNLTRPTTAARMKVRFNDVHEVRVLPDGRLLSLTGNDMSTVQRVLDDADIAVASAITMPESKVREIRASYEASTGRSMADIGGTMWLDGQPDAVESAVKALATIDAIASAHWKPLPVVSKPHPMPTRRPTPVAPDAIELDMLDDTNIGERFPDYQDVTEWPKGVGEIPYINQDAHLASHEGHLMAELRRGQRYAQDRNAKWMRNRNMRRGGAVYCCVFALTGDPGEEIWEKRCEGANGDFTADMCDDLNIDGFSVAFVRNPWTGPGDPANDCFTNCLDAGVPANNYGACCTVGTREGEDQLQIDCIEAEGDFQGFTADPATYTAYLNCDACPQITGSCCFTSLYEQDDLYIWDNQNPIWVKGVCNLEFSLTQEPDVRSFRIRSDAASIYTGWSATLDANAAPGADPLWNWQNDEPTAKRTLNPSAIVSARLMSNNDEERGCDRCVALGGVWQGDATKPQTLPWENNPNAAVACGASLGIIDCDTGETEATSVLGACAILGEPSIQTETACKDAAGGADINEFSAWQRDMITPANSLTAGLEGTEIHEGYWRPFWIQWFTPPSDGTFQVPDEYEFFVPYWEYNGTYTDWTGWDPGRWWDEGFQPNIAAIGFPATSREDWIQILPEFSIETGIMPCYPVNDALEIEGDFITNFTPADYGPAIRFGLPPTCFEWVDTLGLPQQPGDIFEWTDPETDARWPVIPHSVPYVFEAQVVGDENLTVDTFPWDSGWNRWTDDPKFFDIEHDAAQNDQLGYSPSYDFNAGQRYLSEDRPGITRWQYIGDGLRRHPGETPGIPGDDQYGYPVPPGSIQDVYGSCYYQHTDYFPTIPGTEDNTQFPGFQSCYSGTACDEAACCDAVNAIIPGCCVGGVETTAWNSLCVQMALDIIMNDMAAGGDYSEFTCQGIRPFMTPEWPGEDPDSVMLNPWEYNPDARNARLNTYFEATLPSDLRPSSPVDPSDPNWEAYRREVTMAARIAMFAPRCQGIYSPKGQCNVPGSESGLSSWDIVADDENVILGCQDYDCCMRTIRGMLILKDLDADADDYNDFEWVPRQWTQEMADLSVDLCYTGVSGTFDLLNDETPNFFPLQMNISREALRESLALSTSPKTSQTEVVRSIFGPDDAKIDTWTSAVDPTFTIDLTQLIPAPFASTFRASALQPLKNQNVYDVLPAPFHGGEGLALYPEQDVAVFDGDFDSLMKISQNHAALFPGTDVGGRGRGVNVAVLGESAWLQTFGGFGAVHEDLGNILPDPNYDWSVKNVDGTYANRLNMSDTKNAARITAMLGVIGATGPTADWTDLDITGTAGACCLVNQCSDILLEDDCHLAGGTFYRGTTCDALENCTTRSTVPGTNTFGVRGMAIDARTWFFPTQTEFGNRMEDAFLSAMGVLQPGDVLVLAMDPESIDGALWLNEVDLQPLMVLAQTKNIIVVCPAGDRAQDTAVNEVEDWDPANTLIVGGAAPAAEGNYIRWWSSNYAAAGDEGGNTVAAYNPNSVSFCAWGGMVTTTGGNMNLTRTLRDTITSTDQVTRTRSYTNSFGSTFDGSQAAAAQIAGAVACAQGLVRQVYDFQLAPAALTQRLFDSATNGPGVPNGFGAAAGAYPTFGYPGWDLDVANAEEARTVGRFPRLDRFALDVALLDPPDDDEVVSDPPAFQARFDVIAGTLVSGDVAYIRAADDDLEIRVDSVDMDEGLISTNVWLPGDAWHLGFGEGQEIMVTFETSGVFDFAEGFSVDIQREGPNRYGVIVPYVFNFSANSWEQMYESANTTPIDENPAIDNFVPLATSDPRFYLNPDPDRENQIYIRMGVACAGSPFTIDWDYVALNGLDTPDDGGGNGP